MRLYTSELVKKYKARTVVDHVSIDVNQGEIVGLLGPNGAGKTTTFYMIVGLIKPNEYVKYVALSRELPQGTKIKLKIMGYEPQTYRSAGAATLNTTIGGQSDQ